MSNLSQASLLKQGAEAKVYQTPFYGRQTVVKERFPKVYRHPLLDQKLTSRRITTEARCLQKAKMEGVHVPTVYYIDLGRRLIYMEFIPGQTVNEYIETTMLDKALQDSLASKIGQIVAILHNANVVHGDLTTSNMLLNKHNGQLVLIDFGLGYVSMDCEDKGVDLYVLERAFISSHPQTEALFAKILGCYFAHSKDAKAIESKLEEVRSRGRKRSMVG